MIALLVIQPWKLWQVNAPVKRSDPAPFSARSSFGSFPGRFVRGSGEAQGVSDTDFKNACRGRIRA